jgi:molecular chaperone GrpE
MTDPEAQDRKGPASAAGDADEGPPPPPEDVASTHGALTEAPAEAVTRLQGELDGLQDRYLRLAAEFDNFRRRMARERVELTTRAQADLLGRLLDGLEDLARFAHVDPAGTDAKTLHEGIDLVERKIWKGLSAAGLVRVDQTGVPFDPKVHEAVTTAPAADPSQDHTVGTVLQPGYLLGDQLLRPARVLVLTWRGPSAHAGDPSA